MSDIDLKPGWCCRTDCPNPVGCECVKARGFPELCIACAVRELGLPEGAAAGNVVAALLREKDALEVAA